MNKSVFTVKVDDEDVELAVILPSVKQKNEGQIHYNKKFAELWNAGTLVRSQVEAELFKRQIWNEDLEEQLQKLVKSIEESQLKLQKGGIKLSEARDIAIQLKIDRQFLIGLNMKKNELDNKTAEAQSEDYRFDYYVSVCTVYNTGDKKDQKYFYDFNDFLEKKYEGDNVAFNASKKLAELLYGYNDDVEKQYPENQFLLKHKFVDEKLRLINKEGKLVDMTGRLINEQGRYINKDGEYIDFDGNKVTEDGNALVDFHPFLDDDGKPIDEADKKEEVKPVKKIKKSE